MLSFRNNIFPTDREKIQQLLISTGFFDAAHDEIDVALELFDLSLQNGNNVDNYDCLLAEEDGRVVGYVCFAKVPCTISTYEMYWLAVDKTLQGRGIGRKIVQQVVDRVRELGGHKIVLSTAGREEYLPTQRFYVSIGFVIEARIKDYYSIGDDCLIYSLEINQ